MDKTINFRKWRFSFYCYLIWWHFFNRMLRLSIILVILDVCVDRQSHRNILTKHCCSTGQEWASQPGKYSCSGHKKQTKRRAFWIMSDIHINVSGFCFKNVESNVLATKWFTLKQRRLCEGTDIESNQPEVQRNWFRNNTTLLSK